MKIMAIDYGEARTGLAACDRTEYLASPLGTLKERDFADLCTKLVYTIREYNIEAVVVGLPLNMDGSKGEKAQKCEYLAETLRKLVSPIPVTLWDERRTTIQAAAYLNTTDTRGKKRKKVIDEVAATIILESFLDFRRNEEAKNKKEEKE